MLKKDDRTKNIPLIAVTALAREIEQKRIFQVGFSDYICKPYFLKDLHQAILSNLQSSLNLPRLTS